VTVVDLAALLDRFPAWNWPYRARNCDGGRQFETAACSPFRSASPGVS
jgi:hypothetical protein